MIGPIGSGPPHPHAGQVIGGCAIAAVTLKYPLYPETPLTRSVTLIRKLPPGKYGLFGSTYQLYVPSEALMPVLGIPVSGWQEEIPAMGTGGDAYGYAVTG